jgi:hypothetical protein
MRGSTDVFCLRCMLAGVVFSFSSGIAGAVDLKEPILLQSRNGVLDILLVAKAVPVPSLFPFDPKGWSTMSA